MDLSLGGLTRAVEAGEHQLAHSIGNSLIAAGHSSTDLIRGILNRLPGGMHVGSQLVGGGRPRTPQAPHKPAEPVAPMPGDFPILTRDGVSQCGNLSSWGGQEPFPLVGFKSLAAGAQTQGTDLIDFHAAASNPTWITSDDLIPGNIEVFQARLIMTPRLTVTLGFEGIGFLSQWWLIEYINGIEKARWSVLSLALMTGGTGILTSGSTANVERIDLPAIPFRRKYDPNVKAKTALQLGVTTTTVSALDCTLVEEGVRP